MTHDPKLHLVSTITGARTYHFRSAEQLGGWALCTVNDTTGELLITSDWGNWAHRWNPAHLGRPSLTHFIGDRSNYDYLACKLLAEGKHSRVIDADATIKEWRQRLIENRREWGRLGVDAKLARLRDRYPLTGGLAREIWDDIGALVDAEQNESVFIERAYQIEGFCDWVSNEPWDSVLHKHSNEYLWLVEIILPVLVQACAETVRQAA